ncbi:acyltransferase [Candidatus Saccharibacteria bacterium]|nr:acyltransferase [Candidatus Saccharibacteria bacterium]
MNSFYSEQELGKMGFKMVGKNALVSRNATFYSAEEISIGDNVRIDDFCVLSGKITIGNFVHISAGSKLFGKFGIDFYDYSGCSANCVIYSETDDFSGEYMVGAMAPEEKRNVVSGKVILGKYSQLGAGTIVMPGVRIAEGAVTGAMTFVNKTLNEWTINVGIPCREAKARNRKLITLVDN